MVENVMVDRHIRQSLCKGVSGSWGGVVMLPNLSSLSLLAKPTDDFVVLNKKGEDGLLNDLEAKIDPKDKVPEGEEDKVVFEVVVGVDRNNKEIKQLFLASALWKSLIYSLDTSNPGSIPTTRLMLNWDDWVLLRDRFGPKESVYLPHVLKLEMLFRKAWKKNEPLPRWLEGVSPHKRQRSDSAEPMVRRQGAFRQEDLIAWSVETPEERFQSIKSEQPDLVITQVAQNAEQLMAWFDRIMQFMFSPQQMDALRAIIAEDRALKTLLERSFPDYTVQEMHAEIRRFGYEVNRVRRRYIAGGSLLAPTRRET